MYKKIYLLIIISLFLFILTACSKNENGEQVAYETKEVLEEETITFKIDQIALSKAFQLLDAKVDIIEKGANLKLLVTAGLVESSGIDVDRITMTGNTLNLYLTRKMEEDKIQLAVPQITLELTTDIKNIDKLKFNIVPLNYEPIPLKFNKNQILEKVCTELKIEPITLPEVELYKANEKILWNIYFPYLLNRENSKSPLFNLQVKADAKTGKILEAEKHDISTYLDHGHLLDYRPNELLIYKQEHEEEGIRYESLWSYNLNNGNKKKLYTTKLTINSALISPDGKHIALIEGDGTKSDIFLINRVDNIAYKITPINHLHPKLMKWKDKANLYFIDMDNNSTTLFLYNIGENTSNKVLNLDKTIESFDILDNKLIFAEYDEHSINKNLYLIEDKEKLTLIGSGFKPMLFNNEYIVYLENIEEKNKNILKVYSTGDKNITDTLDYNILNYYKLDDSNILFIENLNLNNQFNFGKYNVRDGTSSIISQINSDKLFYNPEKEKAYISLTIPTKEKNIYNIYSIDLTKVDSKEN